MFADKNVLTYWCFRSSLAGFQESGTVKSEGLALELQYNYNVNQGNLNPFALQKMSLNTRENMMDCETCPKKEFKKFFDYYGQVREDIR